MSNGDALDNLPEDPSEFEAMTAEELMQVAVERPDIVIEALQRCVRELRLVWGWSNSEGCRVRYVDGDSLIPSLPAGSLGTIDKAYGYTSFDVYFDGHDDPYYMYVSDLEKVEDDDADV